jgi:hypothetical protein
MVMTFFHLGADQVDDINFRVRAMVFNATFNNISVILSDGLNILSKEGKFDPML